LEEAEGLESGSNGADAAGASGADPAAVALALNAANTDPSIAEDARAYLREQSALAADQRKLVQLQAKELSHELGLRHWSLWVRHASGLLKLGLELSAGMLLLALVAGISLMVWNAAHSEGLIVESFNVPPDLAARGLTGQVLAGQLTDKLSQLQADTDSNRAPKSYSNDWGDDIKVEIPETGVSIGEAYRFLRRWLGHETHVSGDVWRTPAGLVVAARVDGGGGAITGTEADLDGLIQKAAEDIYGRTQPYRYAVYLDRYGRHAEAMDIRRKVVATGDENERAWAYFSMAVAQLDSGSPAELERLYKLAATNGHAIALGNLALLEETLGRPELARFYYEQANDRMRDGSGDINPDFRNSIASYYALTLQRYRSDYRALLPTMEKWAEQGARTQTSPYYQLAQVQLLDHDLTAARKSLQSAVGSVSRLPGVGMRVRLETQMAVASVAENWGAVLAAAEAMHAALRAYPGVAALARTADDPQTAIAQARLGRFADAERRLSPMPADCYPCLIARAEVANMQKQWSRADWWFARSLASNPSMPLADEQWGLALLKRGQPDAAIEKFKLSNRKASHFADPLEDWGEALMAKNQSHVALAKFAEAEKYAPNWGRLHLKWGEALVYAGKKDEAKAQFAHAAQLDLTAADKAELARLAARG